MNKYVLPVLAACISIIICGCESTGMKTAQTSPYESLVGKTRLDAPKTQNRCQNPSLLANNGPLPAQNTTAAGYAPARACQPDGYQNGWYMQHTGQNRCANPLPGTPTVAQNPPSNGLQSPTPAQENAPLRWRHVSEEESQYASSNPGVSSAGVASALSNPAFGTPAPVESAPSPTPAPVESAPAPGPYLPQ